MQVRKFIFSGTMVTLMMLTFVLGSHAPLAAAPSPQSNIQGPFTITSVKVASFDGDVRRLPTLRANAPNVEREAPRPLRRTSAPTVPAPTAPRAPSNQPAAAPVAPRALTSLQNFDGLDRYAGGGWVPPDPNGDVGPNHYIQAVNIALGIYNKTGAQLAAFSYDALFAGGVAPCNTSNYGDPVVLYDAISDRWIAIDFAYYNSNGPFYECIAVSKSADPVSGGWWLYTVDVSETGAPGVYWFDDYPKLAVWSDGIYMSANMYNAAGTVFESARVFAFNRNDLINGAPTGLRNVYFNVGGSYSTLLPSNLRGALPPPGTPSFFASIDEPNSFHLWKFHVTSWGPPVIASFSGPTDLAVNNFTMPCYGATIQTCVPQLGTTQSVDSLGDRLMMQLQYRNFWGLESLWANHTIAANAAVGYPTGVRWYEIRNPNGSPTVYQQGTFQPDSNYRWMGSLALDREGNMALGYSVSSAGMYPAIRYTGRMVTDPPGQLSGWEASLIEGSGSQIGTYGYRWGDYSAMTIDPCDDLTFWYTNEYFSTTSSVWRTRIGSFQLGGAPAPPMPRPYVYYFPMVAKNVASGCY